VKDLVFMDDSPVAMPESNALTASFRQALLTRKQEQERLQPQEREQEQQKHVEQEQRRREYYRKLFAQRRWERYAQIWKGLVLCGMFVALIIGASIGITQYGSFAIPPLIFVLSFIGIMYSYTMSAEGRSVDLPNRLGGALTISFATTCIAGIIMFICMHEGIDPGNRTDTPQSVQSEKKYNYYGSGDTMGEVIANTDWKRLAELEGLLEQAWNQYRIEKDPQRKKELRAILEEHRNGAFIINGRPLRELLDKY
jgi:hypothetical protein